MPGPPRSAPRRQLQKTGSDVNDFFPHRSRSTPATRSASLPTGFHTVDLPGAAL